MFGKRRQEILQNCPDEFKNELTEWIDTLEYDLMYILQNMGNDLKDVINELY